MTKDEIIEDLKSQIASQERWGTMQGTSWHLEEGVLISGEEARFILQFISVDEPPGPPVEIAGIKIN